MWQIPQNLLNDQFKNTITQKLVKAKNVNNCRAFQRMKNKIIKTQYHSLYTLKSVLVTFYEKLNQNLWKRQN